MQPGSEIAAVLKLQNSSRLPSRRAISRGESCHVKHSHALDFAPLLLPALANLSAPAARSLRAPWRGAPCRAAVLRRQPLTMAETPW